MFFLLIFLSLFSHINASNTQESTFAFFNNITQERSNTHPKQKKIETLWLKKLEKERKLEKENPYHSAISYVKGLEENFEPTSQSKKQKSACPNISEEPKVWEEAIELFKENYKNPYECKEKGCEEKFALRRDLRSHLGYNHTPTQKGYCAKCKSTKTFRSLHPNKKCLPSKKLCKKIAHQYRKNNLNQEQKKHLGKITKIAFYLAAIAPLK